MASDAAAQDQDFTKLSLDERIDHKNWKARQLAYEELAKTFDSNDPKSSKDFQRYGSHLKKALAESNILALEKGLDATFAFVKNGEDVAGRHASEIVAVAISKGFTATKPTIKAKITELILLYIELEKQKEVVEEIITGLGNKSPKVLIGCISTLREAVRLFSPKVVGVKPAMKKIAPLLEERDKAVREETKLLCVELCRWLGAEVLKPQLEGLKPIQVADLEAEFAKVKDEAKPKPERLVRSAQLAAAAAAAEADANPVGPLGDAETAPVEEDAVEVDVSEFIEPVDVLAKLSADFYTKLESKKWQERKESLDELDKLLTDALRVRADADYNELIRVLKKLIQKDANVNIVSTSASCLAKLASRLKSQFGTSQAKDCLAICFEKFKEKKINVVTAVREAVDACFLCVPGIDALAEELIPALNHKTPTVRTETLLFMARAFTRTRPDQMPKPFMKQVAPVLVENTNNADPAVREAAAEAIGTAQKVIGENAMKPMLGDAVNDLMQEKIKAACEKAVILVKPKKAAAPAAAAKVNGPVAVKKPGVVAAGAKKKPAEDEKDASGAKVVPKKVVRGGKPAARPTTPGSDDDDANSEASEKASKPARAASSTRGGPGGKPGGTATKSRTSMAVPSTPKSKKDETIPTSTLVVPADPKLCKKKRLNDEKTLKTLKWNFETPKAEFVELLREQIKNVAAPWLMPFLFSDDFKQHLKAIEALNEALESCPEASLDASDLILKWFSLRFFETNPAVLVKGLEYLAKFMCRLGTEHGYVLNDLEAQSFFPYLMLKSGEPKDGIRAQVRQVIDNCACAYPTVCAPQKMFAFILDGLKSKNARQRAECLSMLGSYIERYGLAICEPNSSANFKAVTSPAVIATLKAVAAQISDRDATVRNASMNCLLEAHAYVQDDMYKMIGKMADKEKSLLVERVKRNAKVPIDRPPFSLSNAPPSSTTPTANLNNSGSSNDISQNEMQNSHSATGIAVPKSQSMGNFRRNNRYSTIVLNKQGKSNSTDMSGANGDYQQHEIDIDGDADDDSGSNNQTMNVYSPSEASVTSPPTALLSPSSQQQNGYTHESPPHAGSNMHAAGLTATTTKSNRLTMVRPPAFAPNVPNNVGAAAVKQQLARTVNYSPNLKLSQADPASLVFALEDVVMPEVSDTDALTQALKTNDRRFFAAVKRRDTKSATSTAGGGNDVWRELLQFRPQNSVAQQNLPAKPSVAAKSPRPSKGLSSELDGMLDGVLAKAELSSYEDCSQILKSLGDFITRSDNDAQLRFCVEYRQQSIGRCLRQLVVKHFVVALNALAPPAAAGQNEQAAAISPTSLLPASQAATLHKIYARVLSIFLSLASSTTIEKHAASRDANAAESVDNDEIESQYSLQVRFYADCLHTLSALLSVERVVRQLLPQGDALHINANKLVLKIVGQTSAPVLIVALLMVMLRVAPGSKLSTNVIHMTQKCVWRLIKRFTPTPPAVAAAAAAAAGGGDQPATPAAALPPDLWHTSWTYAVLKICNDFLTQYPPSYWTDFPLAEANPMRTVKHVMTTIGKCEGTSEFQQQHLSRFDSSSPLVQFVQPLLAKFPQKGELVVNDTNNDAEDLLLASLVDVNEFEVAQDEVATNASSGEGDFLSNSNIIPNHSAEYRGYLENIFAIGQHKASDAAGKTGSLSNGLSSAGNYLTTTTGDAKRVELTDNFVRALLTHTTACNTFPNFQSILSSTATPPRTTSSSGDAEDDPHLSRLLRSAQQAILFSRQRGNKKEEQAERLSGGAASTRAKSSSSSPSTNGCTRKTDVGSTESDMEEDFVAVRIGLGAQAAATPVVPNQITVNGGGVAGGGTHQPVINMRSMKRSGVANNNDIRKASD